MKKLNKLSIIALVLVAMASLSFGQAAFTTTTLTNSVGPGADTIVLGSLTGVLAPSGPQGIRTVLFIDHEAMAVSAIINTSTNTVLVVRGYRGTFGASTEPNSVGYHNPGAVVWVGPDDQYHFNGTATSPSPELRGGCIATNQLVLPVIEVSTGKAWTCAGSPGQWGVIEEIYVAPTNCGFAPTTLTQTTTYVPLGASNIMVVNSVTNAAAGTDTMVCNIGPLTNVGTNQGTMLLDVTALVGSQTVAPTSVGTVTLGSITFPAPAATETPSTVTPVALLGGAVTTVSPTAITTVTTAGAFLTIKSTFANPINISTDRQLLMYTLPLLQSAASAMTVNSAGLYLHVFAPPSLY